MLVFPDFNKQRLLLCCTHFEETEIEADFRDYKSGQERLYRGSLLQIGAKRIKNQGKDWGKRDYYKPGQGLQIGTKQMFHCQNNFFFGYKKVFSAFTGK